MKYKKKIDETSRCMETIYEILREQRHIQLFGTPRLFYFCRQGDTGCID